MKTPLFFLAFAVVLFSCHDDAEKLSNVPVSETTKTISGYAIIKALPASNGWVVLKETLQPQYRVTRPLREIAWLNSNFQETFSYKPDTIWSLNDIVVHPSGQVTSVSSLLHFKKGEPIDIRFKVMRFKTDGSVVEYELTSVERPVPEYPYFPSSIDRARIVNVGEDAYVIARWLYNDVQAHHLSFQNNEFKTEWKTLIEPDHYIGSIGIIGGGYDNFRQGDRYFFVYGDVDKEGNLYIGVPSTEELVQNHDLHFGENLYAETDPAVYDFGVMLLTKLSPNGQRTWSKLQGKSTKKRLLSVRVGDDGIYSVGRVKTGTEPNSWDAWVLKSDLTTGLAVYESTIDVRDGDMFWGLDPLQGGGAIAVGTTDYTQNPSGLSVSDARKAAAFVLDPQGKIVTEIELPQGPAERGSEAMFVKLLGTGEVLFAGAHNAPGTHSAVYCDGFLAVRALAN